MIGAAGEDEADSEPGAEEQPDETRTTAAPEPDRQGTDRIRDYRLLQKLGAGGMGEVWEAEQERPVRRKVALKLIKAGMDTEQVVARFESERQALALMNHPNIAQVFDAGKTERGRPYFAMELVKGEPITTYCDRQRLTTQERLELFRQVCEGVQHAHQKGIIHRDLKPSNVLVTLQDGKPVPKVIDFGVAKATQQRLTERSLFTQMGVLIGTPEYMSPEQAELTGLDVDTRTDLYSLGVLLYELLVGALPFDTKEIRKAGFDEIRRRIREEEPSKPSTRISTLGDESTEAAKRRRTDLPTLRRQLRGDLDWITMKALEKDRTRRYGSPSELVADILRHLSHEPVLAGPPSTTYRMGKFVRRHRLGVTLAAVAVLLLVGFAARERIQARRIAAERDRAEQELVHRTIADARLDAEGGMYQRALETINRALGLDPDLAAARIVRARVLMKMNRTREAAADARAILERDPDDWSAHMIMASAGGWNGTANKLAGIPVEQHIRAVERLAPNTAEAFYARALAAESDATRLELLNRAIELDPGHPEALRLRIIQHTWLCDFASALEDCERLIASRPRSTEGRRAKARVFRLQRNYAAALTEINEAIALAPEDSKNYRERSDVYRDMSRLEEQYDDLTTAMELDPTLMAYPKVRADNLVARGLHEEALLDARRSIDLNPELPYGYDPLFTAYWRLNRRDDLREALQELRRKADGWAIPRARNWAYRRLSRWYRTLEQSDQAVTYASLALEVDPAPHSAVASLRSRAEARRRMGDQAGMAEDCSRATLYELSRPEHLITRASFMRDVCERDNLALADYARAIAVAPGWANPYLSRGWLYKKERDFEKALADYTKAIQLQPTWPSPPYRRGEIYMEMERFEEALADFETHFSLGGKSEWAFMFSAEALLRLGRVEEAVQAYDDVIDRKPRLWQGYYGKAHALFRNGRVQEAIETFDRAIETIPLDPVAYISRAGISCYGSPSCDEVIADLRKGEELASGDPFFTNVIAWVYAADLLPVCPDHYDGQAALELALDAVRQAPGNADYQLSLAMVYYREGMFGEARNALLRSLEAVVEYAEFEMLAHFTLSMTEGQLGEQGAAREHYDRGVMLGDKSYPESPLYLRFKNEAAQLLGK
jgi:serine/threonine protein kinase/tetratricopeptide (TPR) repeat protein